MIYEIAEIIRKGGNTPDDERRIGMRVMLAENYPLAAGVRAMLIQAENGDKGIVTSPIVKVSDKPDGLSIETRNTTYRLEAAE